MIAVSAPGGLVVTLRARKRKNSSFAWHYDQIRFRFYTGWVICGELTVPAPCPVMLGSLPMGCSH
jgi:hypothetical protein